MQNYKYISQDYLLLDRKTDLHFTFERCAVDTIESITELDREEKNEFGYLRISIEYELREYESISDSTIFTRTRYLSLLGIISFLIDEPFHSFFPQNIGSRVFQETIEGLNLQEGNKLLIDDADLTDLLTELIDKLKSTPDHEKSLIFSLFDRWRKARYMENDSEETNLYEDEATFTNIK